ncbi:hypothetical protein GON26_08460 [Flavobacterium sp. GA093]|uniref:Uncharacterized protein n=1 Tax=Flavobacterium hydrocarbonoxydans TaxID=2683249 RepID=A0A6I4NN56_9FLAO|nr:hypothetical protein [Flavobacterium hydrocarbonoxydans]MWB94392.1 hypothetical protein [Flavobacterium hydrocarbonoxydans]
MKKKYTIISLLLLVVIAVALWFFLFNRNNALNSYTSVSSESCDCEESWFPHDQTPPPAEGDGSPFDTTSTTNCIFHQWSWQKFLWLTKPLPSGNPLFLDSLNLVSPEMESVSPQLGLKLVLSSYNQAGPAGVLISNPKVNAGQTVGDTVFYSIHINNAFMDKAVLAASMINSGRTPYSNLETFPVGAFELKVSWININAIAKEKRADYFTTKAAVKNNSGQYAIKTMALLGMHVVGVVKNHPEFIWATFEHKDMAPVYDWKNNNANSATETLFYGKGKTTELGGITWDTLTHKPILPNQAFVLFEYGVPKVSGSGAFMTTSQSEPLNFDNIDNINKCVAGKLKDVFKNYFYNGSIWLNTDGLSSEQQAKTIVKSKISSVLPDSLARGSSNLANITMETYTQTFSDSIHDINAGNLVNCFTCHQSHNFDTKRGNGKSPLYLSHVFESYLMINKPKLLSKQNTAKSNRIEETKALKLEQFKEFVRDHK